MTTSIRDRGRDGSPSPLVRAAARILPFAAAVACLGAATVPAQAAEPWGFEQVTPVGKGSGTVSSSDTFQASPDGDALLHTALLPYADVPAESVPAYVRYIARRGATAWFNRALDPPFTYGASGTAQNVQLVTASSADLSYVMVASQRALTPGAIEGGSNLYLRDTRTGEYTLVAKHSSPRLALSHAQHGIGPIDVKFVAPDGQSAMFGASESLAPGVPEYGPTENTSLYVWTAAEGVRVVSVLPESEGGAVVGGFTGRDSPYDARDALPTGNDGLAHIYFTANGGGQLGGIYVRTGDETKAVSVSRIPGDPSTPVKADVEAVREGGRYLVFTTTGDDVRLTVDTPTDLGATARHIYRYDVTDDSLTYVSTMAYGASVTEIMGVSDDAQTVAFKSYFALTGGAVEGVQNMYVWREGALRFVSAPDSGSTADRPNNYLRRLSPNGRYLAYTDNSPSLAARFGVDIVSARCPTFFGSPGGCDQVYLYDSDADELTCVSCPADGGKPAGKSGDPTNQNDGAARLNGYVPRTVIDDGTAFFTSADSFVEEDRNSANDVYAYRDGQYRLVSRAAQGKRYRFLDATPDGKTVFISTDDPIVGTDNDRSFDIYMTREGAGYPYAAPVVTPPCSGSDCRDPFAPASPLAIAGSVAFAGRGNVDGRPSGSGSVRVSKLRTAIGAGAWLKVRVPAAGRVRVSGPGLKRSSTTVRKAGSYRVAVRLSKQARQKLRANQRVRVRVTVRFAPKAGKPFATRFAMTFKANSSTKKGR
jgi:hypothetical protein